MRKPYSRRNLRPTLRGRAARITLPESYLSLASRMFPDIDCYQYQLTKSELEELSAAVIKEEADVVKREEEKLAFIKAAKTYPSVLTDDCPQCYSKELNIYKISDDSYFGECQDCGISGSDTNHKRVLESIVDALWKQPE